MIEVIFTRDVEGRYTRVDLTGHADYAPHGSDIVCAAVSGAVYGMAYAIIEKGEENPYVRDLETTFTMAINDPYCQTTCDLMDGLRIIIESIEKAHPLHVKSVILDRYLK